VRYTVLSKMIKVALFDADGVVIKKRMAPFSARYATDFGISPDVLTEFYKGDYQLSATGKADIKEILPKYFSQWGWMKSVDELLEYWFAAERETDNEVLSLVSRLRNKGVRCHLATDNEKYRAADLWENVGLKDHFDRKFVSCELGVKKSDREFFAKAISETGIAAGEILFIDDDQKNLDVAGNVDLATMLFIDANILRQKLVSSGIISS